MTPGLSRRDVLRLAGAATASTVMAGAASAEAAWPTRPITLVVPFPAGGASDVVARIFGKGIGQALGQVFVVENRPGAGGAIGVSRVVRSTPDGYTLLLGVSGPNVILPATKVLPYDPVNDLLPVAMAAESAMFLVVKSALPVKSVQDLVALAKSSPGKLNFGNTGVGGYSHLITTDFARREGIAVTHIPYGGNAAALVAFKSGDLDAMFVVADLARSLADAGAVRYIAVTAKARLASAPDLPALSESLPGFVAATWYGIIAPKGTPAAVVERLEAAVSAELKLPDIQKQLRSLDLEPVFMDREAFGKAMRSEVAMWTQLVKETGMKVSE
jgi:tripartite-type tricarboxylate transporter receptor subunit TctC